LDKNQGTFGLLITLSRGWRQVYVFVMALHLDCSILGISSYNDSDGSKNSTYKDGAVTFDYSNSRDLLNVGEYSWS